LRAGPTPAPPTGDDVLEKLKQFVASRACTLTDERFETKKPELQARP